jgi:hypothetical protein
MKRLNIEHSNTLCYRRFAQLHTDLDKLQEAPPLVLPPEVDIKKLVQMDVPTTTTENNQTTSTENEQETSKTNETDTN